MSNIYNPMEVFKYCPHCGIPGLMPDSEKSVQCISCGFRYFFNMSASVAAIIRNENNEILFTIRKHDPAAGLLDLPGGFVDLGETAEEALKREIHEELNLDVIKFEFFKTFTNNYIFNKIEYQTLDLVFYCTVKTLDQIKAADDVSGYVFLNPAKVQPEEIGLDSIKNIIQQVSIRK